MSTGSTITPGTGSGVRSGAGFNPWPYALIAFFAVAILGTATLVYISVTNGSDLVAADYYDQEMRYQKRYDQLKRTLPFEDRIEVGVVEGGFRVRLPSEHGQAGVEGVIELYRPSAARADLSFPLALGADGQQRVGVQDLAAGLWKVRIRWKSGGEDYYAERNLVVKAEVVGTR